MSSDMILEHPFLKYAEEKKWYIFSQFMFLI